MAYLTWLAESVRLKLEAKAIGEPVALRAHFELSGDHGLLTPTTATGVSLAVEWFESNELSLYAQGGASQGYVNVLARFDGGQTALLGAALTQTSDLARPPSVMLLLVGNLGTIRFEDEPGRFEDEPGRFEDEPGGDTLDASLASARGEQQGRIEAAIAQSLRLGEPVRLTI